MGFMIHFENGLTVYFAGSTARTMDMPLWGNLCSRVEDWRGTGRLP